MVKPRIMLITDVYGWGGHERAQKIQESLSDEFHFDIVDATGLSNFESGSDPHFVKWDWLDVYRKSTRWTKNYLNLDEIIKRKKSENPVKRDYDLYYLMFHTMLCWQQINRMMYDGCKILSVITGMPVIKETFDKNNQFTSGRAAFDDLLSKCVGIAANNMISLNDVKQLYDGPTWYIPRGVDPGVFVNKGYNISNGTHSFQNITAAFVGKAHSGKGLNRYIMPACANAGTQMLVNERNYTNALSKAEMCDFYNKTHVYLVASVTDGTPNPALEAAACGRPIISNKIGNMPEFIKDGKNGFLLETRDKKEYTDRIWRLRRNPKEAKRMGERARQTVLDGWTWKHAMVRERAMLKEILS